jgi:hypothetical protein
MQKKHDKLRIRIATRTSKYPVSPANRGRALPQAGLNRELCRLLKPKRFKLDEYGV